MFSRCKTLVKIPLWTPTLDEVLIAEDNGRLKNNAKDTDAYETAASPAYLPTLESNNDFVPFSGRRFHVGDSAHKQLDFS